LEKLRSGIVGESEPLRSFGIVITETSTKAKAMELGLLKTGEAMSAATQITARYAQMLEQSKSSQGDFKNTSDGLAGSLKIAAAETANLKVELGKLLVGPYTVVVRVVAEAIGDVNWAMSAEGKDQAKSNRANANFTAAIERTNAAQEELNAAQRVGDELEIRIAQKGLEVALAYQKVAEEASYAAQNIVFANEGLSFTPALADNAATALWGLLAAATGAAEAARLLSPLEQMTANAWYGGPKGGSGSGAFYGAMTANDLAQDEAEGQAARRRQEAQAAANTRIANDYQAKMEAAGAAMASRIGGYLSAAQQASIGLNDQRGGQGSTEPGKGGAFENIYRLQAWLKDGSWAETGAQFAGGDKGKAAQMVQDFQNNMFSPDVIGAIDVDMLSRQAGMAALAEKSQAAFTAAIAARSGTDSTTANKVLGAVLGFDAKGGNTAVDTVSAKAGARVVKTLGDQLGGKDLVGDMLGFGEVLWGHFEDGIVKQAKDSGALKSAIWEMVGAALAGQGGNAAPPAGVGKTTTAQGVPGL
jgi:hypothetical protein